ALPTRPSFPTRRSSDLSQRAVGQPLVGAKHQATVGLGLVQRAQPLLETIRGDRLLLDPPTAVGRERELDRIERCLAPFVGKLDRSEEHTSELQSREKLV